MGSGFLSLVPFVGSFLGFLVAFSMGLLPADSEFLGTLIRTGVVFGLGEMVEGYVLVPKILGNSLGLHPVVVMVSVFAGGAALGMFGLLIAIPLTASLVIVTRELVLPALAQFADEDGDDLPRDAVVASPGDGAEKNPPAPQ
jgi:predicted PurR-regulated permease PerM